MSQSNSKPLCETEYLLRSPANARRLLAAIKEVEKPESLRRGAEDDTRGACAPEKSAADTAATTAQTTGTPSVAVR
jgi:hypothetical protein